MLACPISGRRGCIGLLRSSTSWKASLDCYLMAFPSTAKQKNWQSFQHHLVKTANRTLAALQTRPAVMCKRSRTAHVDSVSIVTAMVLLRVSTFIPSTFGAILALCVSLLPATERPRVRLFKLTTSGAYILFNFAVVFFCSWLYLGGLRKIKSFFSSSAKQQKRRQNGDAT
jgi:hypothetical protein